MLSLRTGISRRYISVILADDKDSVSLRFAKAIALAFSVSIDYLADMPPHDIDQMPPDEREILSLYRAIDNSALKNWAVESLHSMVNIRSIKGAALDEDAKG